MVSSPDDMNDVEANAAPKSKRAQVSKACQRCKRLQKGCSESRPCQRCIKVGLEEQCLRNDGQGRQPSDRNWSYPQRPASRSPETLHMVPLAAIVQQAGLPPAPVIGYCCRRFFAQLYPTIPILSPEYVDALVAAANLPNGGEAQCLVTAVCALVLMQVEKPDQLAFQDDGIHHSNRELGRILFEKAMADHHNLSSRFSPSLERVLATFFLYAGHALLFHHSQAFFFLREVSTMWIVLRIDEADVLRRMLADRLFWVIMVSERSHGIRYRRPVTLQVTLGRPNLDADAEQDTAVAGLRSLVALFRPLDTTFFALLNEENLTFAPRFVPMLDAMQAAIRQALEPQQTGLLCETQLTNLKVTELWLLIILWQLRLRLGLLVEEAGMACQLTFHYPVEIGHELVHAVRAMSVESIRIHGVGITEKIFDVACAMADVLSRVPLTHNREGCLDSIRYLRSLILKLPGGASTYVSLLDKHISNTLPNVLCAPGPGS
ncbi:hypothetical protein N0V88_008120 [Collariella sp. IMI 366227]|nr:hypothetical protein N0V88_008120 [Collariella sp. IMI 366227]